MIARGHGATIAREDGLSNSFEMTPRGKPF